MGQTLGIDRDLARKIKRMSRKELDGYLTRVTDKSYNNGYEQGLVEGIALAGQAMDEILKEEVIKGTFPAERKTRTKGRKKMIKAIYLTGLIVATAFTLLALLIDDMRREMREEEQGYYREKPHGKEKAALVWAEIGTSLTVGLMWWVAVIVIIGVAITIITGDDLEV